MAQPPRVEDARGARGWDEFVARHDDALIYYSTAYRALLTDVLACRDRSIMATNDAGIVGVLPLLELETEYGTIRNSLPYYGSNGGIIADDEAAEDALVAAYAELAHEPGVVSATVVENPFRRQRPVTHTHVDRRLAQYTPLETWDERLEPSARRNIKRAEAAGFQVARDATELPRLHKLHDEGIRAIGGRPKSREFFERLGEHLAEGKDFDLYVARLEGQLAAGLLVLYFGRTVEYYTPAIALGHRADQPLALLLANALREARERGFTRWNWGGTWLTQIGLRRFKRKWGAEDLEYRYLTHVNDPQLPGLSPAELRRRFGDFFVVPYGPAPKAPGL